MLKKIILENYKSISSYLDFTLEGTNALSSALMRSECFKCGYFYTLLSENTPISKVYGFRYGGVAKGVRGLTAKIVADLLQSQGKLFCIFDDFTSTAPIEDYELYEKYGKRFDKEVYYILKPHNNSMQLIEKCFQVSNATWHSLCVLYESNSREYSIETLTSEDIDQICLKARLIIIGAYDGEGYVFWEKNGSDLFGQYVQSHSETT